MVVIGNFRTAGGLARDQIVMVDLTGATAAVSTDWYTTGYTPICCAKTRSTATCATSRCRPTAPTSSSPPPAVPSAARSATPRLASRRYAVGTALTPTWVSHTGGDTLWGVEVTESAVYVGGHQRWMNNPNGADSAGQGSVPRPGLVALDPQTGVPLKWNPGRNPRGEAAYEIYETDAGVWVDQRHRVHRRPPLPAPAHRVLPLRRGLQHRVEEHRLAARQRLRRVAQLATSNVLYRVNAGGAAIAATDGGPDWAVDTSAAPSPLHNTGSSTATTAAASPPPTWSTCRRRRRSGASGPPSATTPAAAPRCSGPSRSPRGTSSPGAALLRQPGTSAPGHASTCSIDGVTKLSNYDLERRCRGQQRAS